MSEPRYEYRVTWRRKGMTKRTDLRQTLPGAFKKIENLNWPTLAGDPSSDDSWTREMARVPPIEETLIERRVVGDWEPVPE